MKGRRGRDWEDEHRDKYDLFLNFILSVIRGAYLGTEHKIKENLMLARSVVVMLKDANQHA
jgi:hypothetical protein